LIRRLFILFLLLISSWITRSCETNRGEIIPYVRVDETFLIYSDLADLGVLETKFMPGGVNGLVIFRESDLEFRAFDRTCTLWSEHNAAVVEDTLALRCPKCGSLYVPSLGCTPVSGPAIHALIEYHTSLQGDILHVYN
jgi:hypothetical protein